MVWPRGGLLGLCFALLFTLHHGDFTVNSGLRLCGVAAASTPAEPGRRLLAARRGDRGWVGADSSQGLVDLTLAGAISGAGGRKLADVCATQRCVKEIPVCPRCASPPDVDAEVGHCREHGTVYECHRHPVTGALRLQRSPASGGAHK